MDGLPRATAREPWMPGAIVSFESRVGPLMYATDVHVRWDHNVRAIALGLTALRAVDRYGITKRNEQYQGFRQLTAGSSVTTAEKARQLLEGLSGEHIEDGMDNLRRVYRRALQKAHPDGGGSVDVLAAVRDAGRILGVRD